MNEEENVDNPSFRHVTEIIFVEYWLAELV